MNIFELFILAIGLSMDAFAVSICKGLSLGKIKAKHMCIAGAWLAAWEYIPPRRPSVLSAYVGKIARGFAIDCFRKKQAAKRMDGHVADVCGEMDELSFSYVVDEKIAEKELIKIIENFLRKLSDSDRDIFIRRYWYLDSIKDIAKRHGVSQGCIKTNLCRNRKKLYRILKREVLI